MGFYCLLGINACICPGLIVTGRRTTTTTVTDHYGNTTTTRVLPDGTKEVLVNGGTLMWTISDIDLFTYLPSTYLSST